MQNVYEVNPGNGPSTRTIADAGAVEERRRYYFWGKKFITELPTMRTCCLTSNEIEWDVASMTPGCILNDTEAVLLTAETRESALAQAKAMREGAKAAPAPVAATKAEPAPQPAPDAAQAWAEQNAWQLLDGNTIKAAFRAGEQHGRELGKSEGVAHERARVEGLCKEKSNGTYYWTRFVDDIRSGRTLEAK